MTCGKKNHEYGFIEEMVKKYRTDLHREIEPVKHLCQQMSTALNTISAAEKEVKSRKEAKLEEVESTFDTFIQILEQERRYFTDHIKFSYRTQESQNSARKSEISKKLEKLESLIQNVETASQGESDLDFVKGISKRRKNIKDCQECASKVTLRPATASSDVEVKLPYSTELKAFILEKSFVHQKGDVLNSHLQRSLELDLTDVPIFKMCEIPLHLDVRNVMKSFFDKLPTIEAELRCCHRESVETVHVQISAKRCSLSISPKTRGEHELHIKHNGMHICGSPIPVYVTVHPNKITATSKPQVTPLRNAVGIKTYGNKLLVSELERAFIVMDSSSKTIEKTLSVPGVGEVLVDGPHIYATDISEHKLIKMDMNGTILKSTGRKGINPGEFNFPNGIRLSREGEIYVCDSDNNRIQVFDKDLNLVRVIGRLGKGNGCFCSPDDLDFDEDGNIYVAEQDNDRIQVLTQQGEHIRNIGCPGAGYGELNNPVSVAISKNMVYVTDRDNERISVFKTTGEFVTVLSAGILRSPECIAIDRNGYIHVTDDRSRIVTF
jgi:tripartite motif-containing protein 2/3/tripartite motif-containing protein 71